MTIDETPIEDEFQVFLVNVIFPSNPGIPKQIISQMRKVFFAGALVSASAYWKAASTDDEDEGMRTLEALQRELEGFKEDPHFRRRNQ